MNTQRLRAFLLVTLTGWLPGCGSNEPFTLHPCQEVANPLFFQWKIDGLGRYVLESNPSVAQLRVGETAGLQILSGDIFTTRECDASISAVRWQSADPAVAAVRAQPAIIDAVLEAAAPGETTIFADIVFRNGRAVRAMPRVITREGFSDVRTIRVVPK